MAQLPAQHAFPGAAGGVRLVVLLRPLVSQCMCAYLSVPRSDFVPMLFFFAALRARVSVALRAGGVGPYARQCAWRHVYGFPPLGTPRGGKRNAHIGELAVGRESEAALRTTVVSPTAPGSTTCATGTPTSPGSSSFRTLRTRGASAAASRGPRRRATSSTTAITSRPTSRTGAP